MENRRTWERGTCRTWHKCAGCEKEFKLSGAELRARLKGSKTGLLFHNKKCFDNFRDTHPEFRQIFAGKKETTIHI